MDGDGATASDAIADMERGNNVRLGRVVLELASAWQKGGGEKGAEGTPHAFSRSPFLSRLVARLWAAVAGPRLHRLSWMVSRSLSGCPDTNGRAAEWPVRVKIRIAPT